MALSLVAGLCAASLRELSVARPLSRADDGWKARVLSQEGHWVAAGGSQEFLKVVGHRHLIHPPRRCTLFLLRGPEVSRWREIVAGKRKRKEKERKGKKRERKK